MLIKKLLRVTGYLVLLGSIALFFAETMIRWMRHKPVLTANLGTTPMETALREKVQMRINLLWLKSVAERPHPFQPPFDVFVNRDSDQPERMNEIFERSRLAPSSHWTVENFLLDPKVAALSPYTITSNSFGFRDPERKTEKAPGTIRIMVYGSYPAFGHGVNDAEAYPRVLEKILNEKRPGGFQFEVWNGGRQGATAIMGLARLQREGARFKPDLLIWDYGWIELYLRSDQAPVAGRKLGWRASEVLGEPIDRLCRRPVVRRTEICIRYWEKTTRIGREAAILGWQEINREMLNLAKENRLPVMMVRHSGVRIPEALYRNYHDPNAGVFVIDTTDAMMKPSPSLEDQNRFWSKPNWLAEIGQTRETLGPDPNVIYRGDAIQYNALGYRVIARHLAGNVEHLVKDHVIRPNQAFSSTKPVQ